MTIVIKLCLTFILASNDLCYLLKYHNISKEKCQYRRDHMSIDRTLSNKERVIMVCLWENSPLSSTEIVEKSEITWADKAIFATLRKLQDKRLIRTESVKKEQGKPIRMYYPSLTTGKYLESMLTDNLIYDERHLPTIIQSLLRFKLKKSTIDELYEIIEQAKSETE